MTTENFRCSNRCGAYATVHKETRELIRLTGGHDHVPVEFYSDHEVIYAEHVSSGIKHVIYKNYSYRHMKDVPQKNISYWACCKMKCKARIILKLSEKEVLKELKGHDHGADTNIFRKRDWKIIDKTNNALARNSKNVPSTAKILCQNGNSKRVETMIRSLVGHVLKKEFQSKTQLKSLDTMTPLVVGQTVDTETAEIKVLTSCLESANTQTIPVMTTDGVENQNSATIPLMTTDGVENQNSANQSWTKDNSFIEIHPVVVHNNQLTPQSNSSLLEAIANNRTKTSPNIVYPMPSSDERSGVYYTSQGLQILSLVQPPALTQSPTNSAKSHNKCIHKCARKVTQQSMPFTLPDVSKTNPQLITITNPVRTPPTALTQSPSTHLTSQNINYYCVSTSQGPKLIALTSAKPPHTLAKPNQSMYSENSDQYNNTVVTQRILKDSITLSSTDQEPTKVIFLPPPNNNQPSTSMMTPSYSLVSVPNSTTKSTPLSQLSSSMVSQFFTSLDDQPSESKVDRTTASNNQFAPGVIDERATPTSSKYSSSLEEQPTAIVDQPLPSEVYQPTTLKILNPIPSRVPKPLTSKVLQPLTSEVDHAQVLLVPQLYSFIEKELSEVGEDTILTNQQITSELNQQQHVDPHPELEIDLTSQYEQVLVLPNNQPINVDLAPTADRTSTLMEPEAQLVLDQLCQENINEPFASRVIETPPFDPQPSTSEVDEALIQTSDTSKIKSIVSKRTNKPRESKLLADILLKSYISDDSDYDD